MTTHADEREKLLRARAKVEAVIAEFDLIGHVVLAGQLGRAEVFMPLGASWSRLMLEHDGERAALRLKSKVGEYGGNREAQRIDLQSTLGALSSMGELTMHAAIALVSASRVMDEAVGAEHTPVQPVRKQ